MNFDSEYILEEEEEEEEMEPEPVPQPMRRRLERTYFEDTSGFECEIMEFDDEDDVQPQATTAPKKPKLDTNTVSLTMDSLGKEFDKSLKESVKFICRNNDCQAIFSHLDKLENRGLTKVWICKFCGTDNVPELKEGCEWPELTENDTDIIYVADVNNLPNMKPDDKGNYKIIFLIDTSASMCQTHQIKKSEASQILKDIVEKDKEMNQHLMTGMAGGPQAMQQLMSQMGMGGMGMLGMGGMMPGAPSHGHQRQNSDNLDVTRLQAIKAAIITQLEKLKAEDPDRCVGLVTFNEKVTVYGDGMTSKTIEGGQLMDKYELQVIGRDHLELRPIKESADDLIKIIKNLQEEGRTALGPALVIGQEMASNVRGSKVILCTDGYANIGLGKLEESNAKDIKEFYDAVIAFGKVRAVSVSLICIDEAGIATELGNVPAETGGILEKVIATRFAEQLTAELRRQTVATHAEIKFVVSKDMYVSKVAGEPSMYSYLIGNIQMDKRVPFSFGFRQSPSTPQQQPTGNNAASQQQPADNSAATQQQPAVNSAATQQQPADNSAATQQQPVGNIAASGQQTAANSTAPQQQPTGNSAPQQQTATDNNSQPADNNNPQTSSTASQPSADPNTASTSKTPPAAPSETGKQTCPFQVQIFYQDMKGVYACRVWTKEKPLTRNREVAEKTLNSGSSVTTFCQQNSDKILDTKITQPERRRAVEEIIRGIEDFMEKLKKPEDINSRKKLMKFRDTLTAISNKGLTDDLALDLRHFKEDRVPGKA